jgi:hypothetical protein
MDVRIVEIKEDGPLFSGIPPVKNDRLEIGGLLPGRSLLRRCFRKPELFGHFDTLGRGGFLRAYLFLRCTGGRNEKDHEEKQ